jgi:hypothetical protein
LGDRPSLHPDEWCARVLEGAERALAAGGIATVLAHPLCMKVVDDWKTFDVLCSGLSRHRSMFATEAAERSKVDSGAQR